MVQTLEAIRGGGGSVKVGTTGTISALMSRELESTSSAHKAAPKLTSDSVPTLETTPRRLKPRSLVDEASSSSSGIAKSKGPETARKTKPYTGRSHQAPMLRADSVSIDGTPIRPKPVKIVEIVDIRCGNPDKAWVNPISNRLKKLGFSKLSESSST